MQSGIPEVTVIPGPKNASIFNLLDHGPEADGRTAIEAPGRAPLTYGKLRKHVSRTVEVLNGMGYGRNDRIAVALPNGPELAVTVLSVAAGFTCVPLDPSLQGPESERRLVNSRARAIICLPGEPVPALEAARSLGITVIELTPGAGEAGLFELRAEAGPATPHGGLADGEDVAFLLQSSGTTSRPKFIPLTHNNLCYTESRMVLAFSMSPDDRCLNMAPMFFSLGILGSLLSSMAAGGSVACTPGFSDAEFPRWLADFRPTWYPGSPAIHQKILECIKKDGRPIPKTLRFIRSSTFALPVPLIAELERVLGTVVLEVYGLTEAGQVTSNPLPPRARKPGSVGMIISGEVAILDGSGHVLTDHSPGEIVVRGPNVMKGYDGDPVANSEAFVDGWLRTGDVGYFDEDGYLYVTGRAKEFINRGGVKVSPYEVEEALRSHPAVLDCVAFPIPDRALGEVVGAAVIPRAGVEATAEVLRVHALERLSYYKVPSRVFFVEDMPKTSTGKVQRLKIAEKLGIRMPEAGAGPALSYVAPSTGIEKKLAGIWSDVLRRERIGVQDDFFALGGDSLKASHILTEVKRSFGIWLPLNTVFLSPLLGQLARVVEETKAKQNWSSLIPLRRGDLRPPLFCLQNVASGLFEYEGLAGQLRPGRPVYGLQPAVIDGKLQQLDSIEAMASNYIGAVKAVQPKGPYHLLGYCFGGSIAYEMARQLCEAGDEVGFLGLVEYMAPGYRYAFDGRSMKMLAGRLAIMLGNIISAPRGERLKRFLKVPGTMREFVGNSLKPLIPSTKAVRGNVYPDWIIDQPAACRDICMVNYRAYGDYAPMAYGGKVSLFVSGDTNNIFRNSLLYDPRMGWEKYVSGAIKTTIVPGDHTSIVQRPDVEYLARMIDDALEGASDQRNVEPLMIGARSDEKIIT